MKQESIPQLYKIRSEGRVTNILSCMDTIPCKGHLYTKERKIKQVIDLKIYQTKYVGSSFRSLLRLRLSMRSRS